MTFQLKQIDERLSLYDEASTFSPLYVDFLEGALAHRRKYGGGKNQLIAKAIGIKPKIKLSVLDVTAGLGRDAFVLASLGCDVLMCERSLTIFKLLEDGLKRAEKEKWFSELSLKLIHADAIDYLERIVKIHTPTPTPTPTPIPDVIYIDPMFPERTKSALVKKEMRILREVVGDDMDSEKLFSLALTVAKKRVVVKRSKLAPTLTDKKPDIIFDGKSSRFDVYLV